MFKELIQNSKLKIITALAGSRSSGKNCRRRGFSMAEVVISAAVLMIMIAGIFLALTGSLNHSMDSRNNIIASELAQEGIELVRNIRDNNLASERPSFDGIGALDAYRMDYDDLTLNNGSYVLNHNNNFYAHNTSAGWNATRFSRRIIIIGVLTDRTITSVVKWDGTNPPNSPNASNCNVGTKCVYAEAVLTER